MQLDIRNTAAHLVRFFGWPTDSAALLSLPLLAQLEPAFAIGVGSTLTGADVSTWMLSVLLPPQPPAQPTATRIKSTIPARSAVMRASSVAI